LRCFACDCLLPLSVAEDRPTGRLYCTDCFNPTLDEQLRLAGLEEFLQEPESDGGLCCDGITIHSGPVVMKELNEVEYDI
jgi:hypothetical protein